MCMEENGKVMDMVVEKRVELQEVEAEREFIVSSTELVLRKVQE